MKENFLEKWFYQYSYQMQQDNGINEFDKAPVFNLSLFVSSGRPEIY